MTVQELYESIGGSYDSAKRILQMDKLIGKFVTRFLDDGSCQHLLDAAAAGDEKGMFEGAHAMKGVCANLGLMDLSHAASDIAEEFRPGNARRMSDDEVAKRLADIQARYDKTIAGIRAFSEAQG